MGVTRSDPHLSPAAPTEQSTGYGKEFPLKTFSLSGLITLEFLTSPSQEAKIARNIPS
jgi:hypothetical protein